MSKTDLSSKTDSEIFRSLQLARESVSEAQTPWSAEIRAELATLEEEANRRGLPAKYGY